MATIKQKRAIKLVVSGASPTEAMRKAKYAPSVIRKPYILTKSKGFMEALAEHGLTEEFVTKALVADIEAKPSKRFFELNLGAEILGMKKRAEGEDMNNKIPHQTVIIINTPQANVATIKTN